MSGGEAAILHRIFQKHHIPPDELFAKKRKHKAFIYASEEIIMDAEEVERKRNRRKGG